MTLAVLAVASKRKVGLWRAWLRQVLGRAKRGWPATRSTVLQVAGLGLLVVAGFEWAPLAGWVTAGVACFVLEWLSRGE